MEKYLAAAGTLGLSANGPPASEEQVVTLVRLGSVVTARRLVQDEHLQLTRVQELLAQDGVRCSYITLRVAESSPGEVAEIDYGRLGLLLFQVKARRLQQWTLTRDDAARIRQPALSVYHRDEAWPGFQALMTCSCRGCRRWSHSWSPRRPTCCR